MQAGAPHGVNPKSGARTCSRQSRAAGLAHELGMPEPRPALTLMNAPMRLANTRLRAFGVRTESISPPASPKSTASSTMEKTCHLADLPECPVHESSSKHRRGRCGQVVPLDSENRPSDDMLFARRSPSSDSEAGPTLTDARVMALRSSMLEKEPPEASVLKRQQQRKLLVRTDEPGRAGSADGCAADASGSVSPGSKGRKPASPLGLGLGVARLMLS